MCCEKCKFVNYKLILLIYNLSKVFIITLLLKIIQY